MRIQAWLCGRDLMRVCDVKGELMHTCVMCMGCVRGHATRVDACVLMPRDVACT